MKSAQLGGTILIVIFVLASMLEGACKFLYVQASESAAKIWLNEKIGPFLRKLPVFRTMFPERAKGVISTDQLKESADKRSLIEAVSAQSPDDLAQKTRKKQAQDDLSKWTDNPAGDPEGQADARSKAYEFAKIFKVSTALLLPDCKIWNNYKDGSQEEWEVPCPHCGDYQALSWENFRDNIDEDDPDSAHFSCIHCGCEIHDYHRPAIMPRGRFVARNPKAMNYHRSFYLWTAHSPLVRFSSIAREWIKAKGIPSAEQVFYNQELGLPYEAEGAGAKCEDVQKRSELSNYDAGVVPLGFYKILVGVDCQDNRVEWTAVAYGRHIRRAVIQHGVIHGHVSEENTRKELDLLLERTWRNAAGHRLPVTCLGIDAGAWQNDVGEWAKTHPATKVIMLKGVGRDGVPLLEAVKYEWLQNGKKKLHRYRARYFKFNANLLKLALYRSLDKIIDPEARAYIAFPRGLDEDYFRQLTAERRVAKVDKYGFKKYQWVKDPSQPNEALDMMNQAHAAAMRHNITTASDEYWDDLEAEFGAPAPDAQMDIEDLLLPPQRKAEGFAEVVADTAIKLHDVLTDIQTAADKPPPAKKTQKEEGPTARKLRELREARAKKQGSS